METKIGNYTIKLHRDKETSHKDELQRFAIYVSTLYDIAMKEQEVENERE